jgi:methionine-gamma-lyase
MERHCSNAMEVAKYLEQHPQVAQVNYLGLESHPDAAIAKRQMKHPGAVLSFELKGGFDAGIAFIDGLKLCTSAVSLGTCDTLISHPASTTHVGVPRDERLVFGITDGLIRMSVGIENVQDIINDLEQAIK